MWAAWRPIYMRVLYCTVLCSTENPLIHACVHSCARVSYGTMPTVQSMDSSARFYVLTYNDGKYQSTLPAYTHNLAEHRGSKHHFSVRHAAQAYRAKVAALRGFARRVAPGDLLLFLDADMHALDLPPHVLALETRSRRLLERSGAAVVLGAELGRYEMPAKASFEVPAWAKAACPERLRALRALSSCRQPQGPCSRSAEYKHPNTGLVLGYAWAINLTTSHIGSSRLRWPTPLTGDQYMLYRALVSNEVAQHVKHSLDYCSELCLNWHQLRRDHPDALPALSIGSNRSAPPPIFHHFNGPVKRAPAGWSELSARLRDASRTSLCALKQEIHTPHGKQRLAAGTRGCVRGQSYGCYDANPGLMWVDPTRCRAIFRCHGFLTGICGAIPAHSRGEYYDLHSVLPLVNCSCAPAQVREVENKAWWDKQRGRLAQIREADLKRKLSGASPLPLKPYLGPNSRLCTDQPPLAQIPAQHPNAFQASGWCTCGRPCPTVHLASPSASPSGPPGTDRQRSLTRTPEASAAVIIIASSEECFERARGHASAAGLANVPVRLPARFVDASDELARCCSAAGHCGKGNRFKPSSRAVMDGGVQAHRQAWRRVLETNTPAVVLEDDVRLLGDADDVTYSLRLCSQRNCSLAFLGAGWDLLLSHAYFITPGGARALLNASSEWCNAHKQDVIMRKACTSWRIECMRPPRGYALNQKPSWTGTLGWGIFVQDHHAVPSFTVTLATRSVFNATRAKMWNAKHRCRAPPLIPSSDARMSSSKVSASSSYSHTPAVAPSRSERTHQHDNSMLSALPSCACFSFCSVADAAASLRSIPERLTSASPWIAYLRGVYGENWQPPAPGKRVEELHHLQLLYAHGLPIANCTSSSQSWPSTRLRSSIRDLSKRVDPLCAPDESRCKLWRASEPVTTRPAVRGVEVYFHRQHPHLQNIAFRWWWRDASRSFAPASTWAEVFRWNREMEGRRHYGFWYVHAAGSGIWLNVGKTLIHTSKLNASLQLESIFRSQLPSRREAAYERLHGHPRGGSPIAFLAGRLGFHSVQTVHSPSLTSELVAPDLGQAGNSACGESDLRTGPRAEMRCDCDRAADVLNCKQIVWSAAS